jgi:hypothetical protein
MTAKTHCHHAAHAVLALLIVSAGCASGAERALDTDSAAYRCLRRGRCAADSGVVGSPAPDSGGADASTSGMPDGTAGTPPDASVNLAPTVTLSRSALDFTSPAVGAASAVQTITVTNTGNADLVFPSLFVLSGSDFAFGGGTCTVNTPYAPNESCTFGVVFDTNMTGTRVGSIALTDNAPDSPQIIALTGAVETIITSATLLFSSGFEGATTLSAISSSATIDDVQFFSGTDTTTGFAWPMTLFGTNPALTGIHDIVGASNPVTPYIANDIETVTGHRGTPTRALKMQVNSVAPNMCCDQDVFQLSGLPPGVADFYERIWMKLNPEFLSQVQADPGNFYESLFFMKDFDNSYRIESYIYGSGSGVPYWYVHGDNAANPPATYQEFWSSANTMVPVPLDDWFLLEVYMHRAADSTGRFFWAVNGQTLGDYNGPLATSTNLTTFLISMATVYRENVSSSYPAYQWVDDVEIWSGPPCASLPCGP